MFFFKKYTLISGKLNVQFILRVMYLNNINNIYIILTELILFFGSLILLFYPLFSNKKFYIIDRNLFFITLIILVLSFISLFLFYKK
jgi:hypothetical protein